MSLPRLILQIVICLMLPLVIGKYGLVISLTLNIIFMLLYIHKLKYYYLGNIEDADKIIKIGSIYLTCFKKDKFVMPKEDSKILRLGNIKIMYCKEPVYFVLFELKILYFLTVLSTLGVILVYYI